MNSLRKNHFELFGVEPCFRVNMPALEAAFRSLQAAVHPDRHAGGSAADQRVSMQMATQVNEAYRTLRDPARRGAYLCELNGVDPGFETNTSMPVQFLMRQIEWREALDEAGDQHDAQRMQTVRDELDAEREALLERLAMALDDQRNFEAAAADLRQLMFLDKFSGEIDNALDRVLEA